MTCQGVASAAVWWKMYSLATGYVADAAALTASAALLANVSATPAGILIAAGIVELAGLGSTLLYERAADRAQAAATPEEQAAATSAWLATFAFGMVLTFTDVAVADWLLPNFDISGFFAYVGTVALVIAASFAVYSPLYVARRVRRMA